MTFCGFDRAAVALLAELPGWSGDQYAAHKERLTAGLVRPGGALVADVAEQLDADLTVTSRGSVSPLHTDLRFAAPGAPRYKDHLLLTAWQGADKKTAPTLWIRIDAERAGFASGVGFTPDIRDRWRATVGGDEGEELVDAIGGVAAAGREIDIAGQELKRVPAPFDDEHPRAALLRHTAFQVRWAEPLPDSLGAPSFADWCAARLTALLPVHRWLVTNLT